MKTFLLLTSLVVLAGCAQTVAPVYTPVHAKAPQIQELIAFHEARVKNDPKGAIGWAMLGEAYLEAARERDDIDLAEKAELAAKKSLDLRNSRNERAALLLANAFLQHHEFPEALGAVEMALRMDPANEVAARMKVDVLLELGRYEEARRGLLAIREMNNPSNLVTLARWNELTGKTEAAVSMLRRAVELVDANAGASPTLRAYFHTRFGEVLWRVGDDRAAVDQFEQARAIAPSDYKTLANLTRVAAHRKEWARVIDLGKATRQTAKMTDVDGLVALALNKLGRGQEAHALVAEIDAANGLEDHLHELRHGHRHATEHEHGHTHDRLYAMLLADQGRYPEVAVHLAKEDLDMRPDIYAWDTYAWTLYRAGRTPEAKVAMKRALALGTHDRKLAEHAAAIGL